MSPAQDLVLVHGWGMSGAVWKPLLPALAAHYRVQVVELPGHGHSPPASAALLDEWALRCLEQAPPRALWLGWSLGGQVAVRAATLRPDRVAALCLVAATPCFVQADGWQRAMPRATLDGFARALGEQPESTLLRFLALQVKGGDAAQATLRELRGALAAAPQPSSAGLRQGLDLLLGNDLRAELAGLACPSCWLFGSRDTLVPVELAGDLGGLAPGAQIRRIEGAGHAPFLSHPQACIDALHGLAAVRPGA